MATDTAPKPDPLELASDPLKTPFDYIVVGSGAGGGVLAARLARLGKRVLVLEAGTDVASERQGCETLDPVAQAEAKLRLVYEVPLYYGAASEDDQMSWGFSVRHFGDTAEQQKDPKYNPSHDPSATPNPNWPDGKGGIFYPRVSGLGGCTNHYAMIVVKPNDYDWERIAALTGDSSWQPSAMQGYFALIEQVLYYAVYRSSFRKALGQIAAWWRRLVAFFSPQDQLDQGGHGHDGWQKTSFISPALIIAIAFTDLTFIRVLIGAILWLLKKDGNWKAFLKSIFSLSVVRFLDPNFRRDWPATPNVALKFIPIGTNGSRRIGLREWLLKSAIDYPENLTIVTCALATRVIFEAGQPVETEEVGEPRPPVPRAIGVEIAEGRHLYEASPESVSEAESNKAPKRQLFARREVILSGGTYNSPQLLNLSGIGDQAELAKYGIDGLRDRNGKKIAEGIDLPGVGKNLQDRYEVGVITQTKKPFTSLDGDTLVPPGPGQPPDKDLKRWLADGSGLYATNGGAIAFLARSGQQPPDRPEADLFVFGVPAAFRGYYWDWSRQLLYPEQVPPGEPIDQRNIWTWVILKAYTHNGGTVKLRSKSPFAQMEIDTDSFARDPETGLYTDGARKDLAAVEAAVAMVRDINASISLMDREVQPGPGLTTSAQIKDWIHHSAWGHHANGTCRMGSDPWRPYPATELRDKGAVLDSRFRVHGVERLRIVDASIFPEIPGYFIVTPIFMAAEKAAETLIADSATYPDRLEAAEAAAVRRRRRLALLSPPADEPLEGGMVVAARLLGPADAEARARGTETPPGTASAGPAVATSAGAGGPDVEDEYETPFDRLPTKTVGLALSGGGIRSATYCLGALQALAKKGRLRGIDFLSTVSGGGYTGSFLGRLFTRVDQAVADKPAYVEKVLRNSNSAEIEWLRTHVNYLNGEGLSDLKTNVGTIWRNLLAVQLCAGTLFIAIFSLLRRLAPWLGSLPGIPGNPVSVFGFQLSPWWWLPVAILLVIALPFFFSFWLVPRRKGWLYALFALLLWVVLLLGAVAAIGIPELRLIGFVGLVVLLLAWLWEALANLGMPAGTDAETRVVLLRNRLTRAAGVALFVFIGAVLWVVLDTLARTTADYSMMRPAILGGTGVLMAILPYFRNLVTRLTQPAPDKSGSTEPSGTSMFFLAVIAFGLLAFLLFALDVLVHWSFDFSPTVGVWLGVLAFAVSAVLGRDVGFLNLSSLQSAYAARLARTFLGASNPERIYPHGSGTATEVQVPDANDDIPFGAYHPEDKGGPLHLIGVCCNETADAVSGRHLRNDKGLQMALGPEGVSVGRRFHSLWEHPIKNAHRGESVERPILPHNDPNAFHVLKERGHAVSDVEPLRLSQWIATSGAAFSTGSGRNTKLTLSLLLGLLNVRLGYWWDSRIRAGQRPGRYPPDFWRRLLEFPSLLFRTQRMLLDEWRGYYGGPSQRYWYLSDGGHFEATGMYELIRRRVRLIIAIDALHDPSYQFQDVTTLIRLAEIDFDATCHWLDPAPGRAAGLKGWDAFDGPGVRVPAFVRQWLDPDGIGPWQEIQRNGPFAAALARVTYSSGNRRPTWLLLLKAAVPPGVPLQVRCYAETNPAFPNDPTADQFLTDEQWESYRELGECTMGRVLRRPEWPNVVGGQAPDAPITAAK
ncbi:MAG TPA: GMC oxidoreductase [Thermoanaerobaculia bacterium]|jgi:choline dehydrogenase-like flavoprotein|nr:GMC oxidoreductase [Thermoanaerobaculia bacterium]